MLHPTVVCLDISRLTGGVLIQLRAQLRLTAKPLIGSGVYMPLCRVASPPFYHEFVGTFRKKGEF